jgi:hypothetical protein
LPELSSALAAMESVQAFDRLVAHNSPPSTSVWLDTAGAEIGRHRSR